MRDKFIQMRPLLKDKNVISDCETQIKEYQKYIDYFTEELHRLTLRQEEGPPENNENASQGTLALPQDHPPRTSSITANVTSLIQSVSNKKKYSNLGKYFYRKKKEMVDDGFY